MSYGWKLRAFRYNDTAYWAKLTGLSVSDAICGIFVVLLMACLCGFVYPHPRGQTLNSTQRASAVLPVLTHKGWAPNSTQCTSIAPPVLILRDWMLTSTRQASAAKLVYNFRDQYPSFQEGMPLQPHQTSKTDAKGMFLLSYNQIPGISYYKRL